MARTAFVAIRHESGISRRRNEAHKDGRKFLEHAVGVPTEAEEKKAIERTIVDKFLEHLMALVYAQKEEKAFSASCDELSRFEFLNRIREDKNIGKIRSLLPRARCLTYL